MLRSQIILVVALLTIASSTRAQEVVVSGFPLGIGRSAPASLFEPYYPQLEALADTLRANPLVLAVVTGSADGTRYRSQNDAKNPSLALGRAHALRDVLVFKFGVDSSQIVIQSEEMNSKGDQFRYAKVRLVWDRAELNDRLNELAKRQPAPIEKHFTEIKEVPGPPLEHMGLKLAAGFSSSPFGGLPIVSGAVTWRRMLFIEAEFGHTFWNGTYRIGNIYLDTKRRMASGYIVCFPFKPTPIGLLAGWTRAEEISQTYHQYVKLSEGPVFGIRFTPFEYLCVTGAYNPSKQRMFGAPDAKMEREQFSLSVVAQVVFGGDK